MATPDQDVDKTLSQLIEKLSETDLLLDQLVQECNIEDAQVLQNLEEVVQLNVSQKDVKREFYELLTPFYQSDDNGNIHNLDLSQLQDAVLSVIGTKGKDELVGLVEGLEGFKKRVDGINETVVEFMIGLNIVPIFTRINERKRPLHLSSLPNITQQVDEEKSEVGVEGKESGDLSVRDAAIRMYGFAEEIAVEIEESLQHRKLIQNEILFLEDEAEIWLGIEDLDGNDEWQKIDPKELNWAKVKKLKKKFEELKKKIYAKKELDPNAEPEVSGDRDEDPESLTVQFLRVIRNWIFRIESVLFNFIIYELYYMLPGNETAETIFENFRADMKNLMETDHGRVPITVHKIIYMMENPTGVKQHGVVIRTPTVYAIDREGLQEKIRLTDVMDQVHNIILRLRRVLATSGLSYTHVIMKDELAFYENMLKQSEEEVREIERTISEAKSQFTTKRRHM